MSVKMLLSSRLTYYTLPSPPAPTKKKKRKGKKRTMFLCTGEKRSLYNLYRYSNYTIMQICCRKCTKIFFDINPQIHLVLFSLG